MTRAHIMAEMELVWPSLTYLPGYVDALTRGWPPDNLRGDAAAREELERIAKNADAFLASLQQRGLRYVEITTDRRTIPPGE